MDQPTFADLECQVQKRKTRREPFPERSDTAKCATGMLAKDTERLTLLSGLGNLLAAKGNWGVVPAATGPARPVVSPHLSLWPTSSKPKRAPFRTY